MVHGVMLFGMNSTGLYFQCDGMGNVFLACLNISVCQNKFIFMATIYSHSDGRLLQGSTNINSSLLMWPT